ncbi:Protein MCM10 [Gossypium australe]|uniref:Protein MCM10 n=1 Tax=Gossypium australe TaxID=47621 RepID=A0A5B6WS32_9ROSI|nr:Protein MCM10 [Gossypium australe]
MNVQLGLFNEKIEKNAELTLTREKARSRIKSQTDTFCTEGSMLMNVSIKLVIWLECRNGRNEFKEPGWDTRIIGRLLTLSAHLGYSRKCMMLSKLFGVWLNVLVNIGAKVLRKASQLALLLSTRNARVLAHARACRGRVRDTGIEHGLGSRTTVACSGPESRGQGEDARAAFLQMMSNWYTEYVRANPNAQPPPPPPIRQLVPVAPQGIESIRTTKPQIDKIRKQGADDWRANIDDDPERAEVWLENSMRVFDELSCTLEKSLKCAASLLRDSTYHWWKMLTLAIPKERVT